MRCAREAFSLAARSASSTGVAAARSRSHALGDDPPRLAQQDEDGAQENAGPQADGGADRQGLLALDRLELRALDDVVATLGVHLLQVELHLRLLLLLQ